MTTSTAAIYTQLRSRILGFIPLAGNPVSASIGPNRFYMPNTAPDSPFSANPNPYATMRLTNIKRLPGYQGVYEEADLEILLYARPKSQQLVLENIADKIDQAMLQYADGSSGVMYSSTSERTTLPPPPDPVDHDVCTIYMTYHLSIWPQYLKQYSDSSPSF